MVTVAPGKACGTCNVCCKHMDIDTAGFCKLAGVLCGNYVDGGCSVYATRPTICRDFYCGWMLSSLGDEWRPDKSEILILPGESNTAPDGVRFVLLALDRIFWKPFVTHLSMLIMQDKPVHLFVPGKVGETSGATCLSNSNLLRQAIAQRDFAATTTVLSHAVQACIAQPRSKTVFVNADKAAP